MGLVGAKRKAHCAQPDERRLNAIPGYSGCPHRSERSCRGLPPNHRAKGIGRVGHGDHLRQSKVRPNTVRLRVLMAGFVQAAHFRHFSCETNEKLPYVTVLLRIFGPLPLAPKQFQWLSITGYLRMNPGAVQQLRPATGSWDPPWRGNAPSQHWPALPGKLPKWGAALNRSPLPRRGLPTGHLYERAVGKKPPSLRSPVHLARVHAILGKWKSRQRSSLAYI